MSSKYESNAIGLSHQISRFSVDSLTVIADLDKHSTRLSKKLDRLIKRISCRDYSDDGTGTGTGGEGEEELMRDLELLDKLRKIIEIIATRKFQLAVKNYDFIDQNIKSLDTEISLLERSLERNGHNIHEIKVNTSIVGQPAVETVKEKRGKRKHVQESSAAGGSSAIGSTATSALVNPLSSIALIALSAEPVYCICKRIAFGDMVACDNDECPIEWFHYSCVSLTKKPKNSWLCPACSSTKKFKK